MSPRPKKQKVLSPELQLKNESNDKEIKKSKVDQKLTEHQDQIRKNILEIKADAKEIANVEFQFQFAGDKEKTAYFEILDLHKLAAGLSDSELFLTIDDLEGYFAAANASNEYKIYISKFESYLTNWAFKNGKDKVLEVQLKKMPLTTASQNYEKIIFQINQGENGSRTSKKIIKKSK